METVKTPLIRRSTHEAEVARLQGMVDEKDHLLRCARAEIACQEEAWRRKLEDATAAVAEIERRAVRIRFREDPAPDGPRYVIQIQLDGRLFGGMGRRELETLADVTARRVRGEIVRSRFVEWRG